MGGPCVATRRPGVALIGSGFIAPIHAESLRRLGIMVVGLLGSEPNRAKPVASRLGIPRVYQDLSDLLADDSVGSVHITSPNACHGQHALAALSAGKHVICEKPLAISSRETALLVEAARLQPQLTTAVCYNIRFYPLCQEMRERVAAGDIGRIVAVTGSYTQDWLSRPTDYNWRVEPDGATNLRAVADIGTHWMDLAEFITCSQIESVFAELSIVQAKREKRSGPILTFTAAADDQTRSVAITTEDQAFVLLRLSDGIRGSFHVSQVQPGRKNRLVIEVVGTEGSLAWISEEPNSLWIGRRDRPNENLIRDPALLSNHAAHMTRYPGGHAEGFPDSFVQLFHSIYDRPAVSAKSSMPDYPTFADGHRQLQLCEAIAESSRVQEWVRREAPSHCPPTRN